MNKRVYRRRKGGIVFLFVWMFHSAFGRMPEMLQQDFSSQCLERNGHTLFLNGQAIHTVSMFKVKVYEISLFLENRSTDPDQILQSVGSKVLLLKFLREVGAEPLRKAFSDGFYENCHSLCDSLKVYLDELNSKMQGFQDGDSLEFQFLPSQVILRSSLGDYF